ncbi:MAG: radical SAM protein [Nanoarchaeota archaeon]|nr:radical SAM protein [Nanoarchaeota archaeon]
MSSTVVIQESKPGYVSFKQVDGKSKLDDLWFMVGSRCNLSCKHCYVGSNPKNDSLQQITLAEVEPFLDEAKAFGVERIYFTGGEPFINTEMLDIIDSSLKRANVTVLTNATYPLRRLLKELPSYKERHGHSLSFRVSLDHYDGAKHDVIRGEGMFVLTVANVLSLAEMGFKPIITSTAVVYEDNSLGPDAIEQKFKDVFLEHGVAVEVKLLPYNLEMGTNLERIEMPSKHVLITESCMVKPGITAEMFQCHNGRTLEKIDGKMVVYPCPIIYNNANFEMGSTLSESFRDVLLTHKACFDFCYKSGGKCTN